MTTDTNTNTSSIASGPAAPPVPAVQTTGLTRAYGSMLALASLDLTVQRGDLSVAVQGVAAGSAD